MDINEKIAANLGLVYSLLDRFQLRDDQDAESDAYEALYKAICTYKVDSKTAFSTYATCVISNTLRQHLRHKAKKRQLTVVSYHEPIGEQDGTIYLLDTLTHYDTAETPLLYNELHDLVDKASSRIISETTGERQRKVLTIWKESGYSLTQKELTVKANASQALVSNALSGFKNKLKKELEEYM